MYAVHGSRYIVEPLEPLGDLDLGAVTKPLQNRYKTVTRSLQGVTLQSLKPKAECPGQGRKAVLTLA